jgi:hypothetical protein
MKREVNPKIMNYMYVFRDKIRKFITYCSLKFLVLSIKL